jgi:hypothetical protein
MSVADKSLLRRRGVALATAGLILALSVGLLLRITNILLPQLVFTFIATCVVQLIVWLIPHFGFDRYLSSDPHYIYVPMLAAAFSI